MENKFASALRSYANSFGGPPQLAARLADSVETEVGKFVVAHTTPQLAAAGDGRGRGDNGAFFELPVPNKFRELASLLAGAASLHPDDAEIAAGFLPPLLRGILAAGSLPEPHRFVVRPFLSLVLDARFLPHSIQHLCALVLAASGSPQAAVATASSAVRSSATSSRLAAMQPPSRAWVFAAGSLAADLMEAVSASGSSLEEGVRQGIKILQWSAYLHLRWSAGLDHPGQGSLAITSANHLPTLAAPWPLMDGGTLDGRVSELAVLASTPFEGSRPRPGALIECDATEVAAGGAPASEAGAESTAASRASAPARAHAPSRAEPGSGAEDEGASESSESCGGETRQTDGYPSDLDDFIDVTPEHSSCGFAHEECENSPRPSKRPAPSSKALAESPKRARPSRVPDDGGRPPTSGASPKRSPYLTQDHNSPRRKAIQRDVNGPGPHRSDPPARWDWKENARRLISIHGPPPPILAKDRTRPSPRPRLGRRKSNSSSSSFTADRNGTLHAGGARSVEDDLLSAMVRRVRRRVQEEADDR